MINHRIQEAIDRVAKMERCFDSLLAASRCAPADFPDDTAKEQLMSLREYYESGQWLFDYELDENGLLPRDMKRGVLSQDALYDFFSWIDGEEQI